MPSTLLGTFFTTETLYPWPCEIKYSKCLPRNCLNSEQVTISYLFICKSQALRRKFWQDRDWNALWTEFFPSDLAPDYLSTKFLPILLVHPLPPPCSRNKTGSLPCRTFVHAVLWGMFCYIVAWLVYSLTQDSAKIAPFQRDLPWHLILFTPPHSSPVSLPTLALIFFINQQITIWNSLFLLLLLFLTLANEIHDNWNFIYLVYYIFTEPST